uniref:Uncharacterized protein n=1 Tax=Salix viminalis TaxID=40686 RepID=A0A6N2MMX7_SALVM
MRPREKRGHLSRGRRKGKKREEKEREETREEKEEFQFSKNLCEIQEVVRLGLDHRQDKHNPLVEQWIKLYSVAVINFRMVRTRQGTRTEPPSFERRRGNQGLLDDTASHAPMMLTELLQGETGAAGEGGRLNQTEEVPPVATGPQERSEA